MGLKFCVDCKSHVEFSGACFEHVCQSSQGKTDLVTGRLIPGSCYEQRNPPLGSLDVDYCGEQGKWWERK